MINKLKTLFVIAIAVICVSSCLDGYSSYKYTAAISFEFQNYDDEATFKDASHLALKNFYTTELRFDSNVGEDGELAGTGFAYSYLKDSVYVLAPDALKPDPYVVLDNDASLTGNHYMTFVYEPEAKNNADTSFVFTYAQYGTFTPSYYYIANNLLTIVEAYEDGLTESDWAKVTFTGYSEGKKTGEVSGDLIVKGEPIKTWAKVELTDLKAIDAGTLTITSSKPNIIKSCCIDLIVGDVDITY